MNDWEMTTRILASLKKEDLEDIVKKAREMVNDKKVPDDKLIEHLSDDQLDELMDFIVSKLPDEVEEKKADEKEVKHSEGDYNMWNAFEQNGNDHYVDWEGVAEIQHSMVNELTSGQDTLMGVIARHENELIEHGITSIDELFTVEPDTGAPGWIRPEEPSLVSKIMQKVKKTPRHTVHGRWADITDDDARARGYIKNTQKVTEVFGTLNRRVYPQTVYKAQSFDRDDWVDVTDFDLVSWIKPEMQEMLSYELARAILIGDGRADGTTGKINEANIIPIAKDLEDGLFANKVTGVTAENFVAKAKQNRRLYKGNGKPSLYIDLDLLTDIELLTDDNGRYLYGTGNRPATDEEVAMLAGAAECVAPEFMDGTGLAILVNLGDYELACPNKGAATMFDDFDIDFNKMKYLIETRVAGALNTPKAAVIFSTEA